MRKFLVIFLLIFSVWQIPRAAYANYSQDELSAISVYERISPAIVSIEAQLRDGISAGTGCIVSPDGLILTGSHVVENFQEISVTTFNGQTYKAEFIAQMGKNKDLALIKINPQKKLKAVSFADSETVKVGQKVLSIGNPFGFSNTLTQGIILLNSDGEVIGISQSIYNPDNNISNIGIGFAIPSNEAVKFIATVDKSKIHSKSQNK